jgi:hypothetical protein
MRAYEFDANYEGDWAIHCHKSHHTMNAMGHDLRTFIGVDQSELKKRMSQMVKGYMPMGAAGMADMGEMEMPLPDNTLPMMTGFAQFGPVEMGGMFSVVKVREGLDRNDYKDPGWYENPEGTVAFKWTGDPSKLSNPVRAPAEPAATTGPGGPASEIEVKAVKPNGHSGH